MLSSQVNRPSRARALSILETLLATALATGLTSGASASAPPRLSAERRAVRLDSAYGSGAFGAWIVDRFGLPAFRYDVDEETDPRASQPELRGATGAQHQVGNDHIVAAAFNHGYTQLWSQARLSQWANLHQPEARHYAGGFGYLNVEGAVLSTFPADRPQGAELERVFGVGYFSKRVRSGDFSVEQVTYAPFGDDPVLLDDVTITNHGAVGKYVSWFEYWDVNPYDQTAKLNRGVGNVSWDSERAVLSVSQSGGGLADEAPLTIFASPVRASFDGLSTSLDAFFGTGTRALPDEVAADRTSGVVAGESPAGSPGKALFVVRSPMYLASGQSMTLRYLYGIAHAESIPALVAKYRADDDPLGASARAWRDWLPKADFGSGRRWVARELQWDAYLLRSASVYEEVCGHHTITQGGYYQYDSGQNLGLRSWLHYMLPVAYTAPELAREILRYAISLQDEEGSSLPYGTGPLCTKAELGTSNDADFWLLLAASEYGLASRDSAFFSEQLPFYDSRRAVSVWEHLKRSYAHQETYRGPHGGYLTGTNGDWSDFSTRFLGMTESTLVTAQLAHAYPRLAELARLLGDDDFAVELDARGAELRQVVRGEWTGKGWYSRGYAGAKQIGVGAIFLEPQPWAILAGIPTAGEAATLVGNVQRFLGGVDAPPEIGGPSRIGSAITPAANDPEVTELSLIQVGGNVSNYPGGVWFDPNGWLTWALGELDGSVSRARDLAWNEYTSNTLANHATQFPDHWDGTISVDDACNAFYSPNASWCGIALFDRYRGQITEQATWMVMDAIRLAGITPTRAGYTIAPHLPFERFSFGLPQIGIASESRRIRGYLRLQEAGEIELRVRLPRGAARSVETWADGRRVAHQLDGGFATFHLVVGADAPADWAITWQGGALKRLWDDAAS